MKSPERAATKRGSKIRCIGTRIKKELSELVKFIERGGAHYVRCIKPNPLRKAHTFEPREVLTQLRCSGVMQTVQARKAGWPVSHTIRDFALRYAQVHRNRAVIVSETTRPEDILNHFVEDSDSWRIGKNKVLTSFSLFGEKIQSLLTNHSTQYPLSISTCVCFLLHMLSCEYFCSILLTCDLLSTFSSWFHKSGPDQASKCWFTSLVSKARVLCCRRRIVVSATSLFEKNALLFKAAKCADSY